MQPVIRDESAPAPLQIRFQPNKIVQFLAEFARMRGADWGTLAHMSFTREDREQLAQLVGCTVASFADLPYASREAIAVAELEVAALPPPRPKKIAKKAAQKKASAKRKR